jgi:molybdenum cofactor cytidylyltransferase
MKTCGIIILAAGNSSRLGHPKQLLTFKGKSLLKHVLDEAEAIEEAQIVLVLGSENANLQQETTGSSALICYNDQWIEGMSGSIHLGIQTLLEAQPDVSCCIITVCDQPYINSQIFKILINKFKTEGCGIIASAYADTAGTPVLFSKPHFADLLQLKGQEGAKKLLKMFENEVNLVPFEKGEIDIDTEADYRNLLSDS